MSYSANLILSSLIAASVIFSPHISLAAQDAQDAEAQQVVVTGSSQPALLSYRDMLAGLDAFDEYHALAPAAPEVRFYLKPHKNTSATLDALTLRIVGDTVVIPVPMREDASFTVPRNATADDENADMVLSKNKNDYSLEIEVHSAGIPDGMRRLGDLRLECQVGVAIAKYEIGFFWKATINTLLLSSDWCMADKVEIPSYMKQSIASATLIDGDQRIPLKIGDHRHSFQAPINKKIYSNNDLVELQFTTEPELEANTPTTVTSEKQPDPADIQR